MTTLSNPDNRQKVATNHLWWVTIVAIILAVVGNTILYFIGRAVVPGGLLAAQPGGEPMVLPLGVILGATVLPAIVGAIILVLLNRTLRPITIFRWLAVVVTLLSFIPVFQLPSSVTIGNKIMLALMHIVAAAAITGILTTFGRARS